MINPIMNSNPNPNPNVTPSSLSLFLQYLGFWEAIFCDLKYIIHLKATKEEPYALWIGKNGVQGAEICIFM